MLILTLDSALERVSAAVLDGDCVLAAEVRDVARGIALLPGMAQAALGRSGHATAALDAIGVTVGPGSFTGIRGALALAHGIGIGSGVPIVAVTVPEALAALDPAPPGRALWIAIDNRRGGIFLAREGRIAAFGIESLPRPSGPIALGGDAAQAVAAWADGADVTLTGASLPSPAGIARAVRARLAGELAPLAAQPLYVDPPATSMPTGRLRRAPVG